MYLGINYIAIRLCKDTLPNLTSTCLFKVNKKNTTRKRPDIWSKLPMKVPESSHCGRSGVFIIKSSPSFPIVDFEQVNICWENYLTFYSFDICFKGKKQCRESRYFLISHIQYDEPLQTFNYSDISFKEDWKVWINATTNFRGHKNKAGNCRESITSDHFPF